MMNRVLPLLCLWLLIPACEGARVWVESDEEFEVQSQGIRHLRCKTENGAVKVAGKSDAKAPIHVQVTKRGGGETEEDAKAALAAIQVTRDTVGDALQLGWKWVDRKSGWHAQVGFSVTAPDDRAVTIDTSNGAVDVEAVRAATKVETSNGRVTLQRCLGDWDVETSNGAIAASGTPASLSLRSRNGAIRADIDTKGPVNGMIRTSNGAVTVALAEEASARIKAETSNGKVSAHKGQVHASGRHHADVSVNGGQGVLSVDTSNGSIDLR